jgi:hypothetical protein
MPVDTTSGMVTRRRPAAGRRHDHLGAPALPLRARTAAAIKLAGYGDDDPLVVGLRQGSTPPTFVTSGRTAAGESSKKDSWDTESTLAPWMPELPAWAGTIKVRHLIHHTGGLPEGAEFNELHQASRPTTTMVG